VYVETRYARAGDVHIAYQVVGQGPIDLVLLMGWVSHLEYGWEGPSLARFLNRLASFSRLILFDKRGTGLSDRVANLPTLEERMDDVRAVLDAIGSERAALFGTSEGGPMCALFAATYPERTTALVMYGSYAARKPTPDYPWAPTPEARKRWLTFIEQSWGTEVDLSEMAPSMMADEQFRQWWITYLRRSASPGAVVQLGRMNSEIDIRDVLPAIRVPTLILHRKGDKDSPIDGSRWMAQRIPGATFVELPGIDHLPFVEHDALVNEVQAFLTGVQPLASPDQVLATVLAVAPVAPTTLAADIGERRWRDMFSKEEALLASEVQQQRGRMLPRIGDALVATFDGPTRALRCALAMIAAVNELGIQVRAGLHTSECDRVDGGVGGTALRIAARVMGLAGPGEVLASSTVRDLVAGSGMTFEEQPGVIGAGESGTYRVYRVGKATRAADDMTAASPRADRHTRRANPLTAREREVAIRLARGLTNREIAEDLVISSGTADRHVTNILNKLGYHSRGQVAVWAGEHGLLDNEQS
jgi:pimeloyl-ACP methyl ester carboxylesterase/class 3 adenylate cyclase/DNA-binding CsgD family transcriptional regulator